jgi:hypothetical protein
VRLPIFLMGPLQQAAKNLLGLHVAGTH